jgi:hypothetical protein
MGLGFHQMPADRRLRCNPLFVLEPKSLVRIRIALFAVEKPSLRECHQIQPIVAPESHANRQEFDHSWFKSSKELGRCTNQSTACRQQFDKIPQRLNEWRAAYPALKITVRESLKGGRQQYHMIEGKPTPFESRPIAAWKICLQRSCTQLFKGHLWKCPALAYFATMERKRRLEAIPAWQLFRDYKACPPTASDNEVREFFATREIPQCGLCPARKIPFHHQAPTIKDQQQ